LFPEAAGVTVVAQPPGGEAEPGERVRFLGWVGTLSRFIKRGLKDDPRAVDLTLPVDLFADRK
jgi:hypothetical protein